jgi:phosphoserine phosphatase RsbU/P
MRKRLSALALALALASSVLVASALAAQTTPAAQTPAPPDLIEIGAGWFVHQGDNPAFAQPGFDDTGCKTLDIDNMGPATAGWRWYRKHLHLGPGNPDLTLLIEGGDGAYELYANGVFVPGATLHSAFNVYRPTERAFDLHSPTGDFALALRTHAPTNYVDYHFPLFISLTVGSAQDVEYERAALQAARLDGVWPSIAINLLLCLAGLGVLLLYLIQRAHRDYLFLGLYLFVLGLSNGLWNLQLTGVAPTSLNFLVSDPLTYVFTILQIEFTFSFVGKRPGRALRVYQGILLLPWILAGLCWVGRFPSDTYALIEAAITIPVAFLLTTLLLVWYRRGNREAGWLILPSLLPLTMAASFDLGFASIVLGWGRFDFLDSLIPIGLLQLQPTDLANLLFLIAIAVVMFFRFSRVSREQARVAVELEAAREVQQRLVPPAIEIPGFRIESAYFPAEHVGGDFLHLRASAAGGLLIVLGDVSGKGLPAALSVAALVGALRALPELAPAEVLGALNRGLHGEIGGGFVTCCAVHIAADGSMTLANAGHLSPYLDGREIDTAPALPLGLIPDAEFPERVLRLTPGSTLTLITDGVVEARNAHGELYGFDRTQAISTQSADAIARAAQHYGQEDDITVLSIALMEIPLEVAP